MLYLCSEESSYSGNVESIYTLHIFLHIHFSIILVQLQTMQRKQESLTWSGFAGICSFGFWIILSKVSAGANKKSWNTSALNGQMSMFVKELSAYKMAAAFPYAAIKSERLFYSRHFFQDCVFPDLWKVTSIGEVQVERKVVDTNCNAILSFKRNHGHIVRAGVSVGNE
jgi:hypothetical protein